MALDRFGRNIHYLRISLTDHCNYRCMYCMPEEISFRPGRELMQDDEVLLLTELFARLGFDKIRLTGGEPTVRANITELVRKMKQIPGVDTITMTTNGALLKRLAAPLAEAGLERVNISIDTLNPERFHSLTRWGNLDDVWQGILAAEEAGMVPVKLNAVIMRGFNEMDVVDLARLALERCWQIRFIEMMPFAGATELQTSQIITTAEIQSLIEAGLGPLEQINAGTLDGEARLYRLVGGIGDIGFISSISHPFCASCSRARLTADGHLRLCLLREDEVDLLTPLRQGAGLEDLRQMIVQGIWEKPWGHGLKNGEIPLNRAMNEIGG